MLRGLYTAASGMMTSMLANDTLANNLANVSTTGYKKNQLSYQSFPELIIQKVSAQGNEQLGGISSGNRVRESRIDFSQGMLRETGNTFDMALEGNGFFTLQSKDDPNKTYYTRAGSFTMDSQGFLTTTSGDYVLGKLGKINVIQAQPPYTINKNGDIAGQTSIIDRITITRFKDDHNLAKASDNYFEETPYTEKLPEPQNNEPVDFTLHQGSLEQSNTNAIGELVNSISGLRLYEALQKNITMQNETLGKAVNEVGRYR